MNNFFKMAAVGALALAVPMTANAALIDFEGAAADERAILNGAVDSAISSLNLTFYAYDITGGGATAAWAYLDNGAGLGVCRELDGNLNDHAGGQNECKDSGDDNLQIDEQVTVTFDFAVDVTGLLLNAEGHGPLGLDKMVTINDVAMLTSVAQAMTWTGVSSMKFDFGDTQYYVSAMTATPTVPAPAALGLLGFGLGALGIARRRRS